jgi:hypothetical protein
MLCLLTKTNQNSGGGTPSLNDGVKNICNYNSLQAGGIGFGFEEFGIKYLGNDGGRASAFCAGGGGGAGGKGGDGLPGKPSDGANYTCLNVTGGIGVDLGDVVGTDYGSPGGWFGGGGCHWKDEYLNCRNVPGGGGSRGIDFKSGRNNTGGGGIGCGGAGAPDTTCEIEELGGGKFIQYGARGGSGVAFVVFSRCPCNT